VSKEFSYSILTYKHSLFLGEVLNVGVLLLFPEENIIEFHFPKKITRIKNLYSDFNERLIKDYLKAFERKCKTLTNSLDKYVFDYNDFITENLIIDDASPLQFETFRSGIYYSSVEVVRERYLGLILSNYSKLKRVSTKITDRSIIKNVKSKILELNPESIGFLKTDNDRILVNKHIQFKSDFYWDNGVTNNYTKALSFDLDTEEEIINRSILINGKLRELEKTNFKHSHIDLVLQAPCNLSFTDAYLEAEDILKDIQMEKRLFENWLDYSKIVADNIKV